MGIMTVSAGKGVKDYAEGHRERLGTRYRVSGEAALQDYELLELLLTFAIPRRDTKPLVKKLLERFGTLAHTLNIMMCGSLEETLKVAAPGKG